MSENDYNRIKDLLDTHTRYIEQRFVSLEKKMDEHIAESSSYGAKAGTKAGGLAGFIVAVIVGLIEYVRSKFS